MHRPLTKNPTIIITKYTWHHRYREIIQITAAPDARFEDGKEKTSVLTSSPGSSVHRVQINTS